MGTRPWHLARARHHLAVAQHLAVTPDYLDWALVALFYAAHQQVHSCLSGDRVLPKDERHPRKHVAPGGFENGGRGTNQLVRDRMRPIYREYIDLFDASRRTRYDFWELGEDAFAKFMAMYGHIESYVAQINRGRPDVPSDAP